MKKIIYIAILIFSITDNYAQQNVVQEYENLQKYWYYRFRLKNDFMLMGTERGMSIPATTRSRNVDPQFNDVLKFGDGGAADLGWYIGVLATEYKLLSDLGQPTDTTVMELYYALEAFNRIDYNAESYIRCGCSYPADLNYFPESGDLNGFFIRDDAPDNIVDQDDPNSNYAHFNQGIASSGIVNDVDSRTAHGKPIDATDELGHTAEHPYSSYESIDQMCFFLIGISLVNKYVPYYVNYPGHVFMDHDAFILSEARSIADRIITYMKDKGNNPWTVDDPVNHSLVVYAQGAQLSYGFAEAACKITDINNGTHAITGRTCGKYHDGTTLLNMEPFEALQIPPILAGISPVPNSYNDHLVGILAAIGNSWYLSMPIYDVVNWYATFLPPPFVFKSTNLALSAFFTTYHKREYLPLLRKVLHDGGCAVNSDKYDDLLNSAPACGPWNIDANNRGPYDWSTTNRFRDPESRWDDLKENSGEYNGLDYMLLYNLYSIAHPENTFLYLNKMDLNTGGIFPYSSLGLPPHTIHGNHAHPSFGYEFNTLKFAGHIFPDGDVTYRAGREIELKLGFGAEKLCDFGAYIEPMHCSGTSYSKSAHDESYISNQFDPTDELYFAGVYNTRPNKNEEENASSTIFPASKSETSKPITQFSITPNPSSGIFTLQLEEQTVGDVFIYNSLGQVVYHAVNQQINQATIDLSLQPKGIYFVKVQLIDKVYSEKIIIQ